MQIDHFLKQGKGHKMCEDYIISGDDPFPYVILSDGCSSSKDTDVGARILCYLARQYLTLKDMDYSNSVDMGSWIIHNAEMMARHMGLKASCLDATLIVMYKYDELSNINIAMYGDGCVIIGYKDDSIDYYSSKFNMNAPYYLSYKLSQDDNLTYLNQFGKFRTDINKGGIESEVPLVLPRTFSFNPPLYNFILISSDGIDSFINQDQIQVPIKLLLGYRSEFLKFKNTNGNFVQRRVKREILNYEKAGTFHYDDISIGGFWLGD